MSSSVRGFVPQNNKSVSKIIPSVTNTTTMVRWFGKRKHLTVTKNEPPTEEEMDERWDEFIDYDDYPPVDGSELDKLGIEEAIEKLSPQVTFSGDAYYEVVMNLNRDSLGYLTFDEEYNGYIEGIFKLPFGSGRRPRIVVMTRHPPLIAACKELGVWMAGDEHVLGPKFVKTAKEPVGFDRIIATTDLRHVFYAETPFARLLEHLGKNPKPIDSTLLPPNDQFVDIVKAHLEGDIVRFGIDVQNDGSCSVLIGKFGQHNVQQVRDNLYAIIDQLYTMQIQNHMEKYRNNDEMLISQMALVISQIPKHRKDSRFKHTDYWPLHVRNILKDYIKIVEKELGWKPTTEYLSFTERMGLTEEDLKDDDTLNKCVELYLEKNKKYTEDLTEEALHEYTREYMEDYIGRSDDNDANGDQMFRRK
jgi:ribosomal protein L1